MSRVLVVAAAQLGPIPRSQPREEAVARLVAMMEEARRMGADLVVYPEAALTAFFPHWWIEDEAGDCLLARLAARDGAELRGGDDQDTRHGSASGHGREKGPSTGPGPATVVRRITRRWRAASYSMARCRRQRLSQITRSPARHWWR